MRDEKYLSSQTAAKPKTNKDTARIPKNCAEKMHNSAANKAPFMSGARSADKAAPSGGHAETSRKFIVPNRGCIKAGRKSLR